MQETRTVPISLQSLQASSPKRTSQSWSASTSSPTLPCTYSQRSQSASLTRMAAVQFMQAARAKVVFFVSVAAFVEYSLLEPKGPQSGTSLCHTVDKALCPNAGEGLGCTVVAAALLDASLVSPKVAQGWAGSQSRTLISCGRVTKIMPAASCQLLSATACLLNGLFLSLTLLSLSIPLACALTRTALPDPSQTCCQQPLRGQAACSPALPLLPPTKPLNCNSTIS